SSCCALRTAYTNPSPYTTLFRSVPQVEGPEALGADDRDRVEQHREPQRLAAREDRSELGGGEVAPVHVGPEVHGRDLSAAEFARSEEHTSELQSRVDLVCRPLPE